MSEFAKCGAVRNLKIIIDRETGRSKGFAFVEFATEAEAQVAIQALDGAVVGGRNLAVRVAEDKPRRTDGPRTYAAAPTEVPPTPNNHKPNRNFGPSKPKRGAYDDRKPKGRRRDDSDWG